MTTRRRSIYKQNCYCTIFSTYTNGESLYVFIKPSIYQGLFQIRSMVQLVFQRRAVVSVFRVLIVLVIAWYCRNLLICHPCFIQ